MAITISEVTPVDASRLRLKTFTITCDTSYPTGGYAITAALEGITTVLAVLPQAPLGYVAGWDHANQKVTLARTGASSNAVLNEVTAAVNVSAVVIRALVIGI